MYRVTPDRWSPSDGISLEPNALAAVREILQHLAVIAGPGAGKTEMLAQRASFLLMTGACPPPWRILALCFKREAVRTLEERVRRRCGEALSRRFQCVTFHSFAKSIVDRFRLRIDVANRPDEDYEIVDNPKDAVPPRSYSFEHLIPLCQEVFTSTPQLKRAFRATYSFVLLDEFQDCTDQQYDLIRTIFLGQPSKLTAVGDQKQRIMGFAKALPNALSSFAGDFKASKRILYQNHRSQPRIRRLLFELVKTLSPGDEGDQPLGEGGVVTFPGFARRTDEAKAVLESIQTWVTGGTPLHEIAIFSRQKTTDLSEVVRRTLSLGGVLHRDESKSQNELNEPLARALICLLVIATRDSAPEAWGELLYLLMSAHRVGPDDDAEEYTLSRLLGRRVRSLRQDVAGKLPADYFRSALNLIEEVFTWERIRANWPQFVKPSFIKKVGKIVRESWTEAAQRCPSLAEAADQLNGVGIVRILNLHKCKGMEFDRVIILGVEPGEFWGDNKADIQNELFVAVSRARKSLLMTRCVERQTGHYGIKSAALQAMKWFDDALGKMGVSVPK